MYVFYIYRYVCGFVEVLEKVQAQIDVLKSLFSRLAEIVRECPGQYYRLGDGWFNSLGSFVYTSSCTC